MYHFDYLTLLLSGVFDAQARIVHRIYNIASTPEQHANFRDNKKFRKEIKDNDKKLFDTISGQYFHNVMVLLYALRNTIHGASLPTIGVVSAGQGETSFVDVLPEYRTQLWNAAKQHSSPEQWGLIRTHNTVRLEPYTYTKTLTDECFKLIDAIAAKSDVSRLFPTGSDIPDLKEEPPNDGVFDEDIRVRLAILE